MRLPYVYVVIFAHVRLIPCRDQFDGCDWLMLVVTCQDLILSLVLYTELEGEVVCTLQE